MRPIAFRFLAVVALLVALFGMYLQDQSIQEVRSRKHLPSVVVDELGLPMSTIVTDKWRIPESGSKLPSRAECNSPNLSPAARLWQRIHSTLFAPISVHAFFLICGSTQCSGAYMVMDTYDCCPAGGGTYLRAWADYVGGNPYMGFRQNGTKVCTNGGCPEQCREETCS